MTILTLYGLRHLEGKLVDVTLLGFDIGTGTVTNGKVAITLSAEVVATYSGDYSVLVPAIGLNATAKGQLLPPQVGSVTGKGALGRTRRVDQFAALLFRSSTMKFGTDFSHLDRRYFNEPNAVGIRPLFTGVWEGTIEASYDFNNMIAWQQDRPGAGAIVSIAGFISAQDR